MSLSGKTRAAATTVGRPAVRAGFGRGTNRAGSTPLGIVSMRAAGTPQGSSQRRLKFVTGATTSAQA